MFQMFMSNILCVKLSKSVNHQYINFKLMKSINPITIIVTDKYETYYYSL